MRHVLNLVPVSLAACLGVACGGTDDVGPGPTDIARISLESVIPAEWASGTEGVAVDKSTGHIFVLNHAVGIIELDGLGEHVKTYKNGDDGLNTGGATDIGLMNDGRFVLATNGDTLLYNPSDKTQISFFCLVPAIQDSWLENGAVTVDAEGERVLAAPAYYENGGQGPETAFHVAYSAINGDFISQVDVRSTGFIAHGLAFDGAKNRMLAVNKNHLGVFATTGALIRTISIDVSEASGLALDPNANRAYVAQRNQRELAVFDLSEM